MKKALTILFAFLMLLAGSSKAQFAKALPQANPAAANSDATYNIGIIGGINATRWFDWGGNFTNYEQPVFLFDKNAILPSLLNHGLAGIVVERKLGENNSIGIEALYANRWTNLLYEYTRPTLIDTQQSDRAAQNHRWQDSVIYHEINVQVPLSHFFLSPESKIRPYAFVAPRFTLPLFGISYSRNRQALFASHLGAGNADYVIDTLPGQSMRHWNIGAVAGVGIQFRFDIASYYLLLRLDASCQLGLIEEPSSFSRRHIGDAAARFTLLFPLKKLQKDACLNWGEYD